MIKVGERVRRNPDYKGESDHTKRDKWENYFTEVGVVTKIALDASTGNKYPVVSFPSIKAVYTEWRHSLIKLGLEEHQLTLEEQGFGDELFKI